MKHRGPSAGGKRRRVRPLNLIVRCPKRMRLEKEQSRERMRQLRALWNEWDPIGVTHIPDGPTDEYNSYAGQTMRLLEAGDSKALVEYLRWVVNDHMGLSGVPNPSFEEVAAKMQQWFSANWAGTHA